MKDSLVMKITLKDGKYGYTTAPIGFNFPIKEIQKICAEDIEGNKYTFILKESAAD